MKPITIGRCIATALCFAPLAAPVQSAEYPGRTMATSITRS